MYENKFNNEAAASYALKFCDTPNPIYPYMASHGDGGGDCTNFISQCLHAGGAPMDHKSSNPWWFDGSAPNKRWSLSWSVAHSLYWCLKSRNAYSLPGLKGVEVRDIKLLSIGDLIQYENASGRIYHSAIVTEFGVDGPLITQHSYNASNIPYIKSAAKKMHFIKIIVD